MHLFAAKPGGFVDDEGIVDLQQTPATIVILSAADSSLAALAGAIESLPADSATIRLANWMNLLKPAAYDLYEHKVLEHAQVVVLSLLGGASYWQYGFAQLQSWAQGKTEGRARTLIIVPGDDTPDEQLFQASTAALPATVRVWRYLREGGYQNARQLVLYLEDAFSDKGLDAAKTWQEPQPLPSCLLYMPSNDSLYTRVTLGDWRQRWQQLNPAAPVALLVLYRSHLQSANVAMFDDLIHTVEHAGINILPVAVTSLKDAESLTLVNTLLEQSEADLLINTTGFASNATSNASLASQPTAIASPFSRDVPVLQLILSSSTEEDWQQQTQGLRSRDIAMQVVLPEMDGRIITRAVSFKSQAWYSERCQISLVRYCLQPERAEFVARLARNYLTLKSKDNAQKRIALILANYPTKDGRIGNGVGLDTPQSMINILNAMFAASYQLADIPANGNRLIEALLGSVTNNPNTLHELPCWQSISLNTYQAHFSQLPAANRQAVLARWGGPETDPKCRNGRLMIAGIRLGEQFIGIQPARGFNLDLLANYHDPDLVPPHSYLAFYFWLRHEYKVDAVVHVGKHGNLEWLPGKGTALSNQCWPDVALGALPHFYPFIVNDPGEGAQTKRRTHAVVIDHLMPPMTRAEVYGDLAELEALVDEYYQAMGMDLRRENWLRDKIMQQVTTTNIYQELSIDRDALNDTQVLEQLDTYLCDIKESQIRHGLHILGELPVAAKLGDTIVALLRLPRGSAPVDQGILHNLVDDLSLVQETIPFDALQTTVAPWQGEKPAALLNISDQPWRTSADTRERLELLASSFVQRYVLQDMPVDAAIIAAYPKTSEQLVYARSVLLLALEDSADREISALIKGLAGRFIEPGPSGAPTRGRLDTLPTGRNFFSVDNRAIPSPAAWALGKKSAQSLIERHLQDHGDYPRELGLSVWGTATMRTGGDDIAQAFALMGVKPVWAAGSQRVVDFEITPTMLLRRPRVDVTLRVSGFFRDAFPNVMRLFDAAVLAIAALEEPGDDNIIQQNIVARAEQLIAAGMQEEQAKRQASYRVFGSKPGSYGAGLQGLIDERCWETPSDLAEAYVNWGGYAYGGTFGNTDSRGGVAAKNAFEHRLSQLDGVVQNQDNREHDLLDSDDYYQFQGGMSNAVSVYKGEMPAVYHNDHSNPAAPRIRTLKEELNRVIRSRVLNPKWIEAMREHGYKGAFEMSASVDYMFAYDATTNLIDDYQYELVSDALIFDNDNRQFLQDNNPAALEEMAERLLEATQRGLWSDNNNYAARLQDLLLQLDADQEGAS